MLDADRLGSGHFADLTAASGKGLADRIGQVGMLVENPEIQLVRPPVTVGMCAGPARYRALAFACHVGSNRVRRSHLPYINIIRP
jgi:hypothetical protein